MTYRDRRYARADRLLGWADKRDVRSADARARSDHYSMRFADGAPILVDHHSYKSAIRDRDRTHAAMRASIDHSNKAASMRSRAANIVAAADHAIYSDDPDAADRLRDRIAGLVADRGAIVAFNKAVRGKDADAAKVLVAALPDKLRDDWIRSKTYSWDKGHTFPSYATSNLTGNINRLRKRLVNLD